MILVAKYQSLVISRWEGQVKVYCNSSGKNCGAPVLSLNHSNRNGPKQMFERYLGGESCYFLG